ncbi:MAG: ABC transporter permease, partial [Acidobacteriota bacterium]|nr:ABC transporter permease [Acidobacteriota bacterium]
MRELTYALRSLRRTPVFAGSAILILTLSVGATTAVFGMLYALVLRPLPVPAPHSLVQISTRQASGRVGDLSWRQFNELGWRQPAFSAVIASIHQGVVTVETRQTLLNSSVTGVSGNYYAELGATPALGRLIQPADGDLSRLTWEPVA